MSHNNTFSCVGATMRGINPVTSSLGRYYIKIKVSWSPPPLPSPPFPSLPLPSLPLPSLPFPSPPLPNEKSRRRCLMRLNAKYYKTCLINFVLIFYPSSGSHAVLSENKVWFQVDAQVPNGRIVSVMAVNANSVQAESWNIYIDITKYSLADEEFGSGYH